MKKKTSTLKKNGLFDDEEIKPIPQPIKKESIKVSKI